MRYEALFRRRRHQPRRPTLANITADVPPPHRAERRMFNLPRRRTGPADFRPSRAAARMLDEHNLRPLGKLVVGNLDRIADIDNVGN
jgi:hypothetical protein